MAGLTQFGDDIASAFENAGNQILGGLNVAGSALQSFGNTLNDALDSVGNAAVSIGEDIEGGFQDV